MKHILEWFRNVFVTTEVTVSDKFQPYITFPCEECNNPIIIGNAILPGDVCVIKCENCNESWSVYCKPLEISKTSEFEEVWPHIAEDVEQKNLLTI